MSEADLYRRLEKVENALTFLLEDRILRYKVLVRGGTNKYYEIVDPDSYSSDDSHKIEATGDTKLELLYNWLDANLKD